MCITCINADYANHLCTVEVCILVTDTTTTEVATLFFCKQICDTRTADQVFDKRRDIYRGSKFFCKQVSNFTVALGRALFSDVNHSFPNHMQAKTYKSQLQQNYYY